VHLVGYIIGNAAVAITYCNIYNIFLPAYSRKRTLVRQVCNCMCTCISLPDLLKIWLCQ